MTAKTMDEGTRIEVEDVDRHFGILDIYKTAWTALPAPAVDSGVPHPCK